MAITAAVTLSAATATSPNGQVIATVTVSNSGGAAVNVTGITPAITPSGIVGAPACIDAGVVPLGPQQTVSVAASGSTTFPFKVVALGPQSGAGNANPTTQVFTIGATVYTDDGAVTQATTASLTVSPPTH